MAKVQTYHYAYENGNAARRLMTPDQWEVREREIREEEKARRRNRHRKALKARRQAKRDSLIVISAVVVLCAFFVGYVYLQASISGSMAQIASLESQISDLKAQNSATENRINSNANLQTVKATAVNDLGMVYANSDQIVYYTMDDTDYMDQYDAIP